MCVCVCVGGGGGGGGEGGVWVWMCVFERMRVCYFVQASDVHVHVGLKRMHMYSTCASCILRLVTLFIRGETPFALHKL